LEEEGGVGSGQAGVAVMLGLGLCRRPWAMPTATGYAVGIGPLVFFILFSFLFYFFYFYFAYYNSLV
jgi:hypothetical protein